MDEEDKKYYLVYRIRSNREKHIGKENLSIYGWSSSKKIIKAFLKQRDPKKYTVRKVPAVELPNIINMVQDETEKFMINYIKLKSAKTGEEFTLFMTMNEAQEVEIKIQEMFQHLSSLDRIDGEISDYVMMIINLDTKYYDALDYLGYRPKELYAMFDEAEFGETIASRIADAYDGMACEEYYLNGSTTPGMSALDDVSNKILYSIESFVKVMRDDL